MKDAAANALYFPVNLADYVLFFRLSFFFATPIFPINDNCSYIYTHSVRIRIFEVNCL